MESLLTVKPISGSKAGVFEVEGRSLRCGRCEFTTGAAKYAVGSACPKCGGELHRAKHLVDATVYAGFGQCTCQRWTFIIQPILNRMSPQERREARGRDDLRCDHVKAAIHFMGERKEHSAAADSCNSKPPDSIADLVCRRCGQVFHPDNPHLTNGMDSMSIDLLHRLIRSSAVCWECREKAIAITKNAPAKTVSRPAVRKPDTQAKAYRQPYPD